MGLRIASPLPAATEAIITRIIGAAMVVHTRLGPGLKEGQVDGLRFERQREVIIYYLEKPLRPQRIDLVVEDQVIVEVKAVERLHSLHRDQVISYLRSTGLRIGLLINFNSSILKGNIRRVVV